jgi:hypothetical protein
MAINNATLEREHQLAKLAGQGQLSAANPQKKVDPQKAQKPSPSQLSTNKPQTDSLNKATEIPQVPSLSVPTKQLKENTPEIKRQIPQQATTPLTFLSKPPNSSGQPTNPPPQGSTSSLAQIKNAPPPVTTTLHSQNANPLGGSGNTGPKNTGIVFIGIKSSPA